MKQANVIVKLSKDHEVHLKGVTPLEAMLLTAEHHKNAGGNPIDVDEKSIEEIVVKEQGKPDRTRTEDEELARLRTKYPANKLKVITTEVRNFPTDFKDATAKGVNLALPSGSLSSTKVV